MIYRLNQDKKSRPPEHSNSILMNGYSRRPLSQNGDAVRPGNGSPGADADGGPRERRRPRFNSIVSVASSGGVNGHVTLADDPTPPPRRPDRRLSPQDRQRFNDEKQIDKITNKMIKNFGHDGIVVFKTLEQSCGVVISNEIFQELYGQITAKMN